MSARHVGDILLCRPIFWLSVSCWGILLPTHFPIRKQESVLVRYVQDIDKGEVFGMLTILFKSYCQVGAQDNALSAHLCAEAKHDTHVS